jgi:hypothetical protein
LSQTISQAIRNDFSKVPAEIIADHVLAHLKSDRLFQVTRSLESRAFSRDLLGFDDLPIEEKAFLGTILDFSGVDRSSFAKAWKSSPAAITKHSTLSADDEDAGPLFEDR